MSPEGGLFVDLAHSPWSLKLKALLRDGRSSGEPHCLDLEVPRAPSMRAVLAWVYWLFDRASFSTAAAELHLCSRAFPELKGVLRASIGRGQLPAVAFLEGAGGFSWRLRVAPGPAGGADLCANDEHIPLAQPEGGGGYYRSLEIRETGESRILPGRVIDESLDFADAVSEFFKEGNAL